MSAYTIKSVTVEEYRDTIKMLDLLCMGHNNLKPETFEEWWLVYDGDEPVGYAALDPMKWKPDTVFLARAGVTKALIEMLYTRREPEISPGMLKGRMMRRNTWYQLAPRLRAASSRLGGIRSIAAMSGNAINGRKTLTRPITTAVSV